MSERRHVPPKYVAELGRELMGRQLEIYERRADGVSEATRAAMIARWTNQPPPPQAERLPRPPRDPRKQLPCIHRGEPTGETVACATCHLKTLDVFPCAKHGRCTIGDRPVDNDPDRPIEWCMECDDRCETEPPAAADAVIVNMGAGGLGDALLGLGAVKRLAEDLPGREIVYRVHPQAIPFVHLFDGGCRRVLAHQFDFNRDEPPDRIDRQANLGYNLEVRGRAPIPRWERYARNIGASGWTLPALRDPERLLRLGSDHAGTVVLSPFSTWKNREYHVNGWRTIERLLAEHGYRVLVVDRRDSRWPDRHKALQTEVLLDAAADRVAGVLLNAACVVGNDSGIAHLAGILGRPTVALCSQTTGADIYGCYPQVRSLQGKLACDGCWWQPPNYEGPKCDACCASLQTILPGEVLAAVDDLVLPGIAGGRACVAAAKLAVIRDAVLETNRLAGDAAEFGVWRGGSAKLIDHYLAGPARLHLFDTFTGIPADDPGGKHRAGDFGDTSESEVRAFLAGTRAVFHVGEFPDSIPDKPIPRGTLTVGEYLASRHFWERRHPDGDPYPTDMISYRFVHLDADTYASTLAGCRYFGSRMVPGGIIVFDDYGWRDTPGVQRAMHEAFGDRWERASEYQARVRF